jgi:hypothetical protein
MYEAALNGDERSAKAALLEEFPWVDLVGPEVKGLGEQLFDKYKAEFIESNWNGDFLAYALNAAKDLVVLTVTKECFPALYPRESL